MCGDNSIKAPELRAKIKEMLEVVPETGLTLFESQFNVSHTHKLCTGVSEWSHNTNARYLLVSVKVS